MFDERKNERIRAFIREQVGSIAELEIILLLHSTPSREWTAAEIARTLGLAPDWPLSRLKRMSDSGIFSESPGVPPRYRYSSSSPTLVETVNELAQSYAQRRLSIIDMIYASPDTEIRTFASAFKLRREK